MIRYCLIRCCKCGMINHFETKRKRKWNKNRDDKPCPECSQSVWESFIYNKLIYPDSVKFNQLTAIANFYDKMEIES